MAKSKLLSALDKHKGRDIKLEKQRKQEKAAKQRKEKNAPAQDETDDDEDGGVALEVQPVVNGKSKAKKGKKAAETAPAATEDWETDEDEDEEGGQDDDDDDMPDRAAFSMSFLEDSDSEGSSEDDDEDEEDEEEEDDIPFSDIESLASEDKGDVVPHQRLTINNTSALLSALQRIQLPYSKLAFSEHQSIVSDEPTEIPDVEDDLNRELAIYKQSLAAVKEAWRKLKKEGVSVSRPVDYFAEMVKDDEQMGKIKAKLIDVAAGKKAAAEARKQRDLKKFGKQVQVAKLQERAKEKKQTLEKINLLKRKRSGADLKTTNEEDLFDVALDNATKPSDRREGKGGKDSRSNPKRQKKDQKYGFGGKKRHAKSNDAFSSADTKDFSHKKMKAKTGASKRLGKARRQKRN
ncbi:Ebp2-domain-containing protein [Amniculicola lignicola CBS 123094]|uniref:Ebp2-domain-containing protein n=1 Tax=Amniculicola lignicola CBS 123094 TaxID=1392246 RepID=A0A6A5WQP1_9PLEO|nr:Ebp2-domain-containing protein [Amniculicola lignicola CBS 123094]